MKKISNKKLIRFIILLTVIILCVVAVKVVIETIKKTNIEKNSEIIIWTRNKAQPIATSAPKSSVDDEFYYLINTKTNKFYIVKWKQILFITTYKIYDKDITQREINKLLDNIENKKRGTLEEKVYVFPDPRSLTEYEIYYKNEKIILNELPFSY